MSTHRMGRDRFPYGPAQPEELPPETHWMDYDTLEEVRDNSCNQWELYVRGGFQEPRFFSFMSPVAGRDFYSHRLGAKRKSSALGLL